MKKISFYTSLMLVGLFSSSCHNDNVITNDSNEKTAVIENYTTLVYQNYLKAYNDAVELETTINNFLANPTDSGLEDAKYAWKTARESYGTTEAFRFIDGPIDNENGPEGFLNAWPLDENYIDYVDGAANSGIINNTTDYPTLTKSLLESLNENGGEKNISIGYHAIEFLLWGQDLTDPSDNLPGQRKYTDYVLGGTAANQDRRREYLSICADLLTDHLDYLVNQWKPNGEYSTYFKSLDKDEAIKKMFTGAITLVYAELAVERVKVALYNRDQEDEHSCFSDNTHRDIRLNLESVINVYKGNYGNFSGSSLEDLVQSVNPTIANDIDAAINDAVTKTNDTAIPFDIAIKDGPDSTEGAKVESASKAMRSLGSNLIAGASVLGINIDSIE